MVIHQNLSTTVFNTLGGIVYKNNLLLNEGKNDLQLAVADYSSGIYWVRFQFELEGFGETKSFVKIK